MSAAWWLKFSPMNLNSGLRSSQGASSSTPLAMTVAQARMDRLWNSLVMPRSPRPSSKCSTSQPSVYSACAYSRMAWHEGHVGWNRVSAVLWDSLAMPCSPEPSSA
jgi:hypothetical protein